MTTKLPGLTEVEGEQSDDVFQLVKDRRDERKQLAKDCADRRNHAKEREVNERDVVLMERNMENKLYLSYESQPYKDVDLQSLHGVEFKRNPQNAKPLANQDIDCSAEPEPELPDQAPFHNK